MCDLMCMFEDRPATLVYLDPPYFVDRNHGYTIDAKDRSFHVDLLTVCKSARCMLLISGYETELYEEMLNPDDGWAKRTIDTYTRDTQGTEYGRTEVLWMNAQFLSAQTTGAIPISLTKKEQEEHKINPRRKQ